MAAIILFDRLTHGVLADEVAWIRQLRMASSDSYKCCVKFLKVIVTVGVEHKNYKL